MRALARDIGDHLGVPAHLSRLRRVASGEFKIENAVAWPPKTAPSLIDVTQAATENLPTISLTSSGFDKSLKGQLIGSDDCIQSTAKPRVEVLYAATFENRLVALIGYNTEEGGFRVKRGILLPEAPSEDKPTSGIDG